MAEAARQEAARVLVALDGSEAAATALRRHGRDAH